MSTDNINNLIESVMIHGPEILEDCVSTDPNLKEYFFRLDAEKLNYPKPLDNMDTGHWFMPKAYVEMDIEDYLTKKCPQENQARLQYELELFRRHEMIQVLRMMKYIVDTLRENNVVWGVGRGSSVASYVLYLLGVHKIDSIKYNIPIEEFFKGEKNG